MLSVCGLSLSSSASIEKQLVRLSGESLAVGREEGQG